MKPLRFVLLGHPVRQSVSAAMFSSAFKAAGLPHTYTPIDVPKTADLTRMVNEIRSGLLAGANVTAPHKREVLRLADVCTDGAEKAKATNLLLRNEKGQVVAHNTDIDALTEEIGELTTARYRAAILGAGGAATAAIIAALKVGFAVVGVTSRSWVDTQVTHEAESARIARQIGALTSPWPTSDRAVPSSKFSTALRLQWMELAVQADLVIQATSAGTQGGEDGAEVARLVPFEKMPKHAAALDLVYRPAVTPFLAGAAQHGIKGVSGLGMLVRQAEASYRIWMGEAPPPGVMRRAAETALGT